MVSGKIFYKMIINKSRAVRTFTLPEIQSECFIKPDLDRVQTYSTNIKDWLSSVIDLSAFEVFPINGITEGLNYWMWNEDRSIKMDKGDYQWVDGKDKGEVYYISNPSSIDGNYREIPTDIPVVLDIAYVGSAPIQKIEITDNIETVFFSLSKCFGLRNIRTGWLFTRKRFDRLKLLINDAKYYNYYAHDISESLINKFNISYIPDKLKSLQENICKENNLNVSDVVWLATSNSKNYDHLRRGNQNRVCISQEISTSYLR